MKFIIVISKVETQWGDRFVYEVHQNYGVFSSMVPGQSFNNLTHAKRICRRMNARV